MTDALPPRRFHLLDLAGLVVGYGMASLLLARSLAPRASPPRPPKSP